MQRNTEEGGSGDKSAYRQLNLALQRSVLNVCSEYINYEKQVLIKATFVICADENETVVLGIEELLKYDIQVSRKKEKSSRRDDSPIIVSQARKRTADGRDGEARKKSHVDSSSGSHKQDSIDVDVDCIEIADDDDHGTRANRAQTSRRESNQFSLSPGHRAVPMANPVLTPRRILHPPGLQQNRNMPQFMDAVSPGNQMRPRQNNRRVTFGGIHPGGVGPVQQMRMRNVGPPINTMNQGAASQIGQQNFRNSQQNVNSGNRAISGNVYNQQSPGQSNRTYAAVQQHMQQQQQQMQQQQHMQQQQQLQHQQQQHQLQLQQQQLQHHQQFSRNVVQPVTNGGQSTSVGVQYQHSGNHQYEQVTTPTENGTAGQVNASFAVEQVQFSNTIQPQSTPSISATNPSQPPMTAISTEQLQVDSTNTSTDAVTAPVLTSVSADTIAGNVQNQNGPFFVMPQLQITDVVSLREASDGTKILVRRSSSDSVGSGGGVTTTSVANVVLNTSSSEATAPTSMSELRECSVALVRDSTNGNIVGQVALSNTDSADADQGTADTVQCQPPEGNTSDNTSDQQPPTPDAAPSSVSSDAQTSDASASQDLPDLNISTIKRAKRNSKTAANVKMASLQHQSLEEELEEGSGTSGDYSGRKWGCQLCDRSFRSESGLKVHRLLHDDFRPYKCECSRGFTTSAQYKTHLKKCPKATQSATATASSSDT